MSKTGADVILRILARTFQILASSQLLLVTTRNSVKDRQPLNRRSFSFPSATRARPPTWPVRTLAAPTTTSSTADRQSQTAARGNRRRSRSLQYLEPPLPARLRSASPGWPSLAFESCPLPVRWANWLTRRCLPWPYRSRPQTHQTPRSGLAADPGRLRRLTARRRRSRREPRPVLCLARAARRSLRAYPSAPRPRNRFRMACSGEPRRRRSGRRRCKSCPHAPALRTDTRSPRQPTGPTDSPFSCLPPFFPAGHATRCGFARCRSVGLLLVLIRRTIVLAKRPRCNKTES